MVHIPQFPVLTLNTPPNLQLTRTALIEDYPQSQYVFGRWDAVFGAWKRTPETGAVEFVPSFAFEITPPFGQYIDVDSRRGEPARVRLSKFFEEHQDLFQMDWIDLPESEESPEEINAYLALIPQRFRKSCAALGMFAWLGLEACWFFEEFSDWLERSRWHGRFATAIWHFADATSMPRSQRRELCRQIYNEQPLTLLSTFLPTAQARRYLSLLKRLNGRAMNGYDCEAVRAVSRSHQSTRPLLHMRELQVQSLRNIVGLPRWLLRPASISGFLRGGDAAFDLLQRIEAHPNLLNTALQTWISHQIEAVRDRLDVTELKERWERRIAAASPFPDPLT